MSQPSKLVAVAGVQRSARNNAPGQSWWRYPMLWMVLSGPALVVVASIATAVVAYRTVDAVVGSGAEPVPAVRSVHSPDTPAVLARNHASTSR
jgi:uncharacterized protein